MKDKREELIDQIMQSCGVTKDEITSWDAIIAQEVAFKCAIVKLKGLFKITDDELNRNYRKGDEKKE